MPKVNIDDEHSDHPCKAYSCQCEQCKHVRDKRKNRKLKKKIKRLMNKRARKSKGNGKIKIHYWA